MDSIKKEVVFRDPELFKNIGITMNQYRKVGKFCDFELRLECSGTVIKVHKVILSSSCSYFRALFDSNMIECENGYLEFDNILSDIQLESIVEYLYIGEINVSLSTAKAFCLLALYFHLEDLAKFCSQFLITNIDFDNCLNLWRLGEKLPFESFKKNVYEFILRSADVVLDGASFLDLTMEEIGILISDDKIACSEEKVFTFVMKWLNHDLENRKKFLKNLVEHIRFPLLTDKFIRNEVLTDELLLQTKTILKITFKILESKLSTNDISCLKFDKANSTRVGFCKKNLVFLAKTLFFKDGNTTGYIFDIRANKWMEQSTASPPAPLKFFDLTTIEEKVYLLNEDIMEYYQTYTYDIINNSWEEFELEDMAELDSISVTTMFT